MSEIVLRSKRFLIEKTDDITTLFRTNKTLVLVVFSIVFVRTFIVSHIYIPSGSMNPTLIEGDVVFLNKLAYNINIPFIEESPIALKPALHGDIVSFDLDGTHYTKRVIAVGGDEISMVSNRLVINGIPLNYYPTEIYEVKNKLLKSFALYNFDSFVEENNLGRLYQIMLAKELPIDYGKRVISDFKPVIIPDNCYFVLGDNRDFSGDSRYLGLVKHEQLVSKVIKVAFNYEYLWEKVTSIFKEDKWHSIRFFDDVYLTQLQWHIPANVNTHSGSS